MTAFTKLAKTHPAAKKIVAGKNLPYVMMLYVITSYVMTSYNVEPCARFVARTRVYSSRAHVCARIFTKKIGDQLLSYELKF